MSILDWIIVIGLIIWLTVSIVFTIRKKKKGGCCCGCSECQYSRTCHKKTKK